MPISDGQPSANGGTHQGPDLPPAAGPPLGGRASTPAYGSTLPPREDGAEANTAVLSVLGAVVIPLPLRTAAPSRKLAERPTTTPTCILALALALALVAQQMIRII